MPEFDDPAKAAADLAGAARGLAHASREFTDPADSYRVLGDLQATLISLHQSLRQLAGFHHRNQTRAATDDGDRIAGRSHAFAAAAWLETAARDIDQATEQLMAAFAANGHVAWQPAAPEHESTAAILRILDDRAGERDTDEPHPSGTSRPPAPSR